MRRTCGLQAAGISRLEPGAAIRPHTGPTNRRWTLHLGLVVDAADVDRITLTVAGTARAGAWVQGKVVLCDVSYEHDVVHAGARDRPASMSKRGGVGDGGSETGFGGWERGAVWPWRRGQWLDG